MGGCLPLAKGSRRGRHTRDSQGRGYRNCALFQDSAPPLLLTGAARWPPPPAHASARSQSGSTTRPPGAAPRTPSHQSCAWGGEGGSSTEGGGGRESAGGTPLALLPAGSSRPCRLWLCPRPLRPALPFVGTAWHHLPAPWHTVSPRVQATERQARTRPPPLSPAPPGASRSRQRTRSGDRLRRPFPSASTPSWEWPGSSAASWPGPPGLLPAAAPQAASRRSPGRPSASRPSTALGAC